MSIVALQKIFGMPIRLGQLGAMRAEKVIQFLVENWKQQSWQVILIFSLPNRLNGGWRGRILILTAKEFRLVSQ